MKGLKVSISLLICIMLLLSIFLATAENPTWDCPECGRTGNTGNFCGTCAHPAPTPEPTPQLPPSIELRRQLIEIFDKLEFILPRLAFFFVLALFAKLVKI